MNNNLNKLHVQYCKIHIYYIFSPKVVKKISKKAKEQLEAKKQEGKAKKKRKKVRSKKELPEKIKEPEAPKLPEYAAFLKIISKMKILL